MTISINGTNGLIQAYDYQVLTTGFSYTFAAGTQVLVINPAGTLATGTITMPAAPSDGMTITVSSTQQITTLTMSGNGNSINNSVTLLPAKGSVTYVYRATGTTWWPMQTVPGVLTNATQLYRLNSDLAGANVSTAQSIFGVGVTLAASTVYEFEMVYTLTKTAGTTSHSIGMSFGGTATVNNIQWMIVSQFNTTALTLGTGASYNVGSAVTASNTTISVASAVAGLSYVGQVKGTVSINAGGTFIPQYTLSAAPGGAYSTIAGSYVKIYPVGAAGATVNVGSWA